MQRDDWTQDRIEALQKKIKNTNLVCGVDEVGRGPLAGPVVACAIIMPHGPALEGVRDSKKLSEKKRETLFPQILAQAIGWGIGQVDADQIDRINIRQASLLAMKEAVEHIYDRQGQILLPDLVVVDAEHLEIPQEQVSIIKGDDRIYAISCASIVAKVIRDHYMVYCGQVYPQYALEKNKGYGTQAHREAIHHYGLLSLHRRTFIHGKDLFDHEERKDLTIPKSVLRTISLPDWPQSRGGSSELL